MSEVHDIRAGRLTAEELADNFQDLHPPLNEMQAAVEASRCLFCHDAPCTEACPTGINIPGFIRKIFTGNTRGAAIEILNENIMGGTCANVCPVEELCEQVCVKNTAEDKPVEIGHLQRFATDHLFESGFQPYQQGPESGRHVAVVGAGPAGLSCAHRLALHGHRVTVFESRDKAGGLNEYGIAHYKMVDERAAKEVEFILGVGGIEIKTGMCLGLDITLEQLRHEFDAVFLGVGLGGVNAIGVENEDIPGMHNAVDYIERIRQEDLAELEIGRRVVVIGGGNTAIDIAVQAKKLGAEDVTLVYRRSTDDMGATDYEQIVAKNAGVLIRTWAQPFRVVSDMGGLTGVEFERTTLDRDGRLTGTGEYYVVDADQCFKAVGQQLDSAPLTDQAGGLALEHGKIAVDDFHHTSLGFVYAGGDCTEGVDLTVQAVQDGKVAAETIHQILTGADDG